jgi:hypothetical protein
LLQPYLGEKTSETSEGERLARDFYAGLLLEGPRRLFGKIEVHPGDQERTAETLIRARYMLLSGSISPASLVPELTISAKFGEDIDVIDARLVDGVTESIVLLARPSDSIELRGAYDRQTLSLKRGDEISREQIKQLKLTYFVNSETWLRYLTQDADTTRKPQEFATSVSARERTRTHNLLLTTRWRDHTTLYLGGIRKRSLDGAIATKEVFLKVSYRF